VDKLWFSYLGAPPRRGGPVPEDRPKRKYGVAPPQNSGAACFLFFFSPPGPPPMAPGSPQGVPKAEASVGQGGL